MQLIATFTPEQYDQALDSWAWIGIAGQTPRFASLFGDVFLYSAQGISFLDTMEGTLTLEWATEQELRGALATPEGQDRWLLAGLAMGAHARGLHLGPDQVYDLVPPPIVGGGFDLDHVVIYDFVVAVNLAGQLHEQLKDLPPGTPVGPFVFNED